MEVDPEDLDPAVMKKTIFMYAYRLEGGEPVYVADYGEKGDPYRWMVLDTSLGDFSIHLRTIEEMKVFYRSYRTGEGSPIQASVRPVYRYLVRAGVYRMKLREGCPGCRKFWDDIGKDRPRWACRQCKRCHDCCTDSNVPYSCSARYAARRAPRS